MIHFHISELRDYSKNYEIIPLLNITRLKNYDIICFYREKITIQVLAPKTNLFFHNQYIFDYSVMINLKMCSYMHAAHVILEQKYF